LRQQNFFRGDGGDGGDNDRDEDEDAEQEVDNVDGDKHIAENSERRRSRSINTKTCAIAKM